jgi:hypothetical protein
MALARQEPSSAQRCSTVEAPLADLHHILTVPPAVNERLEQRNSFGKAVGLHNDERDTPR